jgi:acyl-CoA dehydrogenase
MAQILDGDDIRSLLDGLHSFVRKVVLPLEEKHALELEDDRICYDDSGKPAIWFREVVRRIRMESAAAGYYTLFAPEEFGGGGGRAFLLYRIWESLYSTYGPGRPLPYKAVAHWTAGPGHILRYLSVAERSKLISPIMSGAEIMCFALSEPDAGSDVWGIQAAAEREGAGWRLNGVKQWITNGAIAPSALVFAITDRDQFKARSGGLSAFVVPLTAAGVTIDSTIRLYGHVGGDEVILSFQDVFLGPDALVGELGAGFKIALEGVSRGRIYNAGRCVGLAKWALDRAADYALERRAFGKPIAEHQAIQFQLAESAMEIYAAHTMALDCARKLDAGERAIKETAIAKAFTTEVCYRVYDRCMQVHGGMGLTNEMRLFNGWQQARTLRIADGSAEIMRRTIAQRLLKGDRDLSGFREDRN